MGWGNVENRYSSFVRICGVIFKFSLLTSLFLAVFIFFGNCKYWENMKKKKPLIIRLVAESAHPAIPGICMRCGIGLWVFMVSTSQGYVPLCSRCLSVARKIAEEHALKPTRVGGHHSSQDAMFKRLPGSLRD